MNIVEQLYFLCAIIRWLYYLPRLYQHAHDPQFLKNPWLTLWLGAYLTGINYMFNSYYILTELEHAWFPNTHIPLANICRIILFLSVSFMYLINLQQTSDQSHLWVPMLSLAVAAGVAIGLQFLIQDNTYLRNYWLGTLSVILGAVPATIVLNNSAQLPKEMNDIRLAHFIWHILYQSLLSLGALMSFIAAIYGLASNLTDPYSLWQVLAYGFSALAMITLAIVTLPDNLLIKTLYPVHLIRYRRIKRISDDVARELGMHPQAFSGDIQSKEYAAIVFLLDNEPFLSEASEIKQQIQETMSGTNDVGELVRRLYTIKPK